MNRRDALAGIAAAGGLVGGVKTTARTTRIDDEELRVQHIATNSDGLTLTALYAEDSWEWVLSVANAYWPQDPEGVRVSLLFDGFIDHRLRGDAEDYQMGWSAFAHNGTGAGAFHVEADRHRRFWFPTSNDGHVVPSADLSAFHVRILLDAFPWAGDRVGDLEEYSIAAYVEDGDRFESSLTAGGHVSITPESSDDFMEVKVP